MSLIPPAEYLKILARTKLTCVDLIIRNENEQVLLGYRQNMPAQNSWFVPGGAVKKAESIADAIHRVSVNETGQAPTTFDFSALAEHNYPDNFAGAEDIESNFIVLGFSCCLKTDQLHPDSQHEELKWWDEAELLSSPIVHPYTKAYFLKEPPPEVIIFKV